MRMRSALLPLAMWLLAACAPAPVPSPSLQAAPTVDLTPVPAGGTTVPATEVPSAVGELTFPFEDRTMDLTIVGDPAVVTGWRAATAGELRGVDYGDRDIGIKRLSDHELVLGWIGTICDVKASLEVRATRLVVAPEPRRGCDAMAVGRGVVLTYADAVPLAISVEQLPTTLLPER
jgi:hypothetical protein